MFVCLPFNLILVCVFDYFDFVVNKGKRILLLCKVRHGSDNGQKLNALN